MSRFNLTGSTPEEVAALGPVTVTGRPGSPDYNPVLQNNIERLQASEGSVASPAVNGYNQFSVEQFKSKFLEVGLVTPSNFLVKFTPPLSIFDKPENAKQFEDVPFLCGATKLPGMRIATSSLRRYNYGNIIKMPYDTMTDDIELIFYVDASQAKSLDLFHRWIRSIIDIGKDFPGKKTNLVSYRNDYICDKLSIFIVSQLNGLQNPTEMPDPNGSNGETAQTSPNGANPPVELSTGNYAIVECTLHEVFPIQIGDISLDWGEADNFARVSVTFSYRTHEFKFGKFTKKSLGFKTGYSYQPVSSTNTSVTQDPEEKDFLTSVTQFLGKIADTKRKIQQFQTNWKTFQNAKGGLGKLTALGNLAGPGSSLNTTANQLNQIVSMTNFITGNGVAKARSGTKKTTSTLP
jgi:hypothetical protein